jgi:hypothetical protein
MYFLKRLMKILHIAMALMVLGLLPRCEVDDPVKEAVPELITEVTLTFTPSLSGASTVVVKAIDPDGEGVQDIFVEGAIELEAWRTYTMSVTFTNGLAQPSDPEYDITEEVREEGDEHILFYSWTNNVFVSPEGDGNIDNRNDRVNYFDEDENGLPVGLETFWTTRDASSGEFRVLLKHQPELKSESSSATEGETDLDITFPIIIR